MARPARTPKSRPSHITKPVVFQELLARRPDRQTPHFSLYMRTVASSAETAARLKAEAAAGAGVEIGAVVPKRLARRAVTRNAIRRRIYLAVDHWLQTAPAYQSNQAPRVQLVVRLMRAWSREALRSASHSKWLAEVRSELDALFAQAVRHPST